MVTLYSWESNCNICCLQLTNRKPKVVNAQYCTQRNTVLCRVQKIKINLCTSYWYGNQIYILLCIFVYSKMKQTGALVTGRRSNKYCSVCSHPRKSLKLKGNVVNKFILISSWTFLSRPQTRNNHLQVLFFHHIASCHINASVCYLVCENRTDITVCVCSF